eukprot:gene39222-47726_t
MLTQLLVALAVSWLVSSHAATVEELVSKMNMTEKFAYMYGINGIYTGNIPANERLGIPSLNMQDGPQGFRTTPETGGDGSSTSFPSSMTVGATWDRELVYKWTSAMALEFKMKGANMALGPGLGIARVPT